jgi:hypothetical protein
MTTLLGCLGLTAAIGAGLAALAYRHWSTR